MMNDLTMISSNAMEPAQDINNALFMDFVTWIDRSRTTTATYIKNLKAFGDWMQQTGTTRPARQDIISYRQYLTDKGLKANTVNSYLRSVRQFFQWTEASGVYPNIAQNIHGPKVDHTEHKRDALTVHEALEVEASIAATAAAKTTAAAKATKDKAGKMQRSTEQGLRLRAMYLLAVNNGLRTIELHRANVQDIVTRGGQSYIYIWGKGRSEADQKKPIAAEVAQAIREYLDRRTDHYTGTSPLFVSTGNRSKGQRIATTTISTMLKTAMQQAGYDSSRLTAHSLRHTTGTAVMMMTGDIYQTQRYMRHQSPATTEIYLHMDDERQEAQTAEQLYQMYHKAAASF